jgi:hypothetical protein
MEKETEAQKASHWMHMELSFELRIAIWLHHPGLSYSPKPQL